MARGPRSRASRAERRMQKERAASALKHGLPVPTPLPTRARALRTPTSGLSSRTPMPGAAAGGGLPLAVKLVGLALGLLGLVYGLTLFRDHLASVEALAASVSAAASGSASPPPSYGASLNAASLNPAPSASASQK